LLPGVDFGLRLGQFVTTFVDLLSCGFKSFNAQYVVLGLRHVNFALPVFGVRLAVAGFVAQSGTQKRVTPVAQAIKSPAG